MSEPHILHRLSRRSLNSREELIKVVTEILSDSLESIIDTHNTESIIFIYKTSRAHSLLKVEYGQANATRKEIQWYQAVKMQGISTGVTFIESYENTFFAALVLDFINYVHTIDELILEQKASVTSIFPLLYQAFAMDQDMFTRTASTASFAETNRYLLDKYVVRRRETRQFGYLNDLFLQPTIMINNDVYLTPDKIIAQIQHSPALLDYLTPKKLGLIHGDLHCGNILTKNSRVYLVDPNGTLTLPIEYDLGKLLHSMHGGYATIMQSGYALTKVRPYNYTFLLDLPDVYQELHLAFKDQLTDQEYIRGLYAEALHFATLLPHHVSNELEATALFLRCVQLFNDFMKKVS